MSRLPSTPIATSVLLLASVFWGLSWMPLKALSSRGAEGLVLIALCYTLMSAALLPWLWRHREVFRENLRPLLGIFIAGGLANLCFNYALIYGEVVRVMVLFYLLPVWGVLGGRFILKEQTDQWRWLGVVLAVVGAFVLLGGWNLLHQLPSWLDLVALLSGLFFASNNLMFRAVENVPISVKVGALFIGCACFAGIGLVFVAPASISVLDWNLLGGIALFALVWLLWTNLGSQWAVTQMAAGRSSILMIMELVAAVFSAIIVGGEALTLAVVVGGSLVLSATAIEIGRSATS